MKQVIRYYTKRSLKRIQIAILVLLSMISCTAKQDKLVIATAANAQFALQEIADSFTHKTGIPTELVISSSGKHTAQIMAGAPYDVFVSADMRFPEKLYQEQLTVEEPEIYAMGQLVLWAIDTIHLSSVEKLEQLNVEYIAVPNPATAPYGFAAQQALQSLNLWNTLENKFVYGESVAQTNQYILSGAAAIGFTASSIVMAPANQQKGGWIAVADSLYSPIAQGVVILKSTQLLPEAQQFYEFLFSADSREILESFGYQTNHGK